jgi:hypothetical protein
MINKAELLDPVALRNRSDYERNVIEGAHNAGHGPRFANTERYSGGALQQVINPAAIRAAECGAPGCDSDISDGIASIGEKTSDLKLFP